MPYYPMMNWGYYSYMGFMMSLIWIIILLIIAYYVDKLVKQGKTLAPKDGESAQDILDMRYAKGELD